MMTVPTPRHEVEDNGSPVPLRICPVHSDIAQTPTPQSDVVQVQVPNVGWSKITILIKLDKGEKSHETDE
jgi:hypothetical protein